MFLRRELVGFICNCQRNTLSNIVGSHCFWEPPATSEKFWGLLRSSAWAWEMGAAEGRPHLPPPPWTSQKPPELLRSCRGFSEAVATYYVTQRIPLKFLSQNPIFTPRPIPGTSRLKSCPDSLGVPVLHRALSPRLCLCGGFCVIVCVMWGCTGGVSY